MKKIIALLFFLLTVQVFAERDWIEKNYAKKEYRIKMRDGVMLFTAVYSPRDTSRNYPILFVRTPYSCRPYGEENYPDHLGPSKFLAEEKYIFVYQDVRGRFMSEGEFVNMRPNAHGEKGKIDEATDAYDTIDWLVKNIPHNNGKVGMWGISYPGFYAAQAATCNHPALVAVSPQAPISDWFIDDDMHHNGALSLAMTFGFFSTFGIVRDTLYTNWIPSDIDYGDDRYEFFLELGALKNVNEKYFHHQIPFWDSVSAHETYDYFWQSRSTLDDYTNVRPAVLTVGGWYDSEDLFGAIMTYEKIEEHKTDFNAFVMGPWFHGGWSRGKGEKFGDIDFGQETSVFYQQNIELPFFNYFLKGKGELDLPEAYMFETGSNEWKKFDAWPPANVTPISLYFNGDGKITSENSEETTSVSYESDPQNPVPYTKHTKREYGLYYRQYMNEDQRFIDERQDVVYFETTPLPENLTVAGPLETQLFVSITGTDADFVVKLIDVYPEDCETENLRGYKELIRYDIFRGKFRNDYKNPVPFEPNKAEKIKIPLRDILHTFKKGHKIAVQIQSTFFPFFDRNPQKFVNVFEADENDFQKIKVTIYCGKNYPSKIILPKLTEEDNK